MASDIFDSEISPDIPTYLKNNRRLPRLFRRKRLFRYVLRAYSDLTNLSGYAVLDAHGSSDNGNWVFNDGLRECFVQNWIDRMDGRYAGLFLHVCNSGDYRIQSEDSIVVHAGDDILPYRKFSLRVFVPNFGYLEFSS